MEIQSTLASETLSTLTDAPALSSVNAVPGPARLTSSAEMEVPKNGHLKAPAIQIKGARQGLLLVVREDATILDVVEGVRTKFSTEDTFLVGASLFLDLGWREADDDFFIAIEDAFKEHSLQLAGVLSTSLLARETAQRRGHKAIIGRLGLAGHQGRKLKEKIVKTVPAEPALPKIDQRATALAPFLEQALAVLPPVPERGVADPVVPANLISAPSLESETSQDFGALEAKPAQLQKSLTTESAPEVDEPESEATLYIRRTLRSGAKAMYPGNIVVMGDVNPGAELEADGDIVVIGNLRGKAHAGAGGNTSSQIFALSMQAIQLRIADTIWNEVSDSAKLRATKALGPMRAVLKDEKISIVSAS